MAADAGEPAMKRNKLEPVFDSFRQRFRQDSFFRNVLQKLCYSKSNALCALRVRMCDAAVPPSDVMGIRFSNATVCTSRHDEEFYPFGSIFIKGFGVLDKLMKDGDFRPEGNVFQIATSQLLKFFCDDSK